MSDMGQKPVPGIEMNASARNNRFSTSLGSEAGRAGAAPSARLRAIHDLVRSGDYHVPAAAVADRMIERMIADSRRRRY